MNGPARALAGSDCDAARERASLELDGIVDDVGRAMLRVHLAVCPDCARVVAAMRWSTRRVRRTPLEPYACSRVPWGGRVGRGHQSWAGVAVALVALGIGTASLPGAADGPSPLDAAREAAAEAAHASEPPRLPIGQRSAGADFEPGARTPVMEA